MHTIPSAPVRPNFIPWTWPIPDPVIKRWPGAVRLLVIFGLSALLWGLALLAIARAAGWRL